MKTTVRCLFVGCFLLRAANAQVAEPPQLAEYRQAFEKGLAEKMKPVTEAFARSLENLENVRAIREDYEGALRASERRRQLLGESGVSDESPDDVPKEGTHDLAMKSARINGSTISYDAKRDALTGFRKLKNSVQWDLIKVTPGWYKVLATYGCADAYEDRRERNGRFGEETTVQMVAGGTFSIYEDTGLIADTSPPIVKTVVPTGSWDKLVTRNIGRIKLTGTTTRVKLEVIAANNLGIMHLHRLKLVPDAEGDAASGLAGGGSLPEKLKALRGQYRTQIEGTLKPVIEGYIRSLKEMEDKLAQMGELEQAVEVRSERMRMQPLLDDPTAILEK